MFHAISKAKQNRRIYFVVVKTVDIGGQESFLATFIEYLYYEGNLWMLTLTLWLEL